MKTSILIVSALLLLSCEKENYQDTGIITGPDISLCACCGGYFIEIDGETYRFEKTELPGYFTFDDKQLPVKVELNWQLKNSSCKLLNWIAISKIRLKT